ncbi:MAG: dihydropteroate synthase [Candidatus Rokubacteria bacterium]|nr:dihydropteroate synthase [Candidatus Rokubacteria bacterium]
MRVGDGLDVAVMGAINVSRDSFYGASVARSGDHLLRLAEEMTGAGAALLDVGAMSTAPYRQGEISEAEETDRLTSAVQLLVGKFDVPVSADTSRRAPARAALKAGARVVNDVRGLAGDPGVARAVAEAGAGLIVMASERDGHEGLSPADTVLALLRESLAIAAQAGVPGDGIVVDPGIGFFRRRGIPWHEWDCQVLATLRHLRDLGRPVCVGVSRKSFIGALAGEADPARRLPGSLAAAAAAVLGGAHMIRSHDVAETVQAVKVALAIRQAGEGA